MRSDGIEHAPAAHDRQLAPGPVARLQHGDLAAARQQELGQLQAHQPAANDHHLFAQRHPELGQALQRLGAVGHAQHAAGLEHGALGQIELGLGDLIGAVPGHQAA